jgi:hypothetical protein
VVYHWRALRYRRALWRPFCEQTARWLQHWLPPEKILLIVGPSAGYTLPREWLTRFSRIDVLEPDPLARWLLARRFPGLDFHAGVIDCFASPDGPARLAQAYPGYAILFSNVICQVLDAGQAVAWRDALLTAMQGRSWATYHDVVSTTTPPRCAQSVESDAGISLESVLQHFWQAAMLEVYDHGGYRLVPQNTAYSVWSITPQQHHLVAWNAYCMTVG